MRDIPSFDEKKIVEIIKRQYGIKIYSIRPYRHVFFLKTNLGQRVLKPFLLAEEKLKIIVKAKEHLVQNGFTRLIPFIPTLNGKPYCHHGKQIFYLTNFIKGHPCNYDNPFELREATQTFALFHQAAINFDPPKGMPTLLGKWISVFKERIEDLKKGFSIAKNFPSPTLFENNFLSLGNFYIEEGEKALSLLKQNHYLNLCKKERKKLPFCHHDPAHHNILITENNEPILIDFDYLIQDLHIHDLASLIIRNGKESKWNLKRSEYIIKNYKEIKNITDEEMILIYAFITFPHELWFLARSRYIDKKPWPLKYFITELDRKTKYKKERQIFLDNFLYLLEV